MGAPRLQFAHYLLTLLESRACHNNKYPGDITHRQKRQINAHPEQWCQVGGERIGYTQNGNIFTYMTGEKGIQVAREIVLTCRDKQKEKEPLVYLFMVYVTGRTPKFILLSSILQGGGGGMVVHIWPCGRFPWRPPFNNIVSGLRWFGWWKEFSSTVNSSSQQPQHRHHEERYIIYVNKVAVKHYWCFNRNNYYSFFVFWRENVQHSEHPNLQCHESLKL